MQKRIYESGRPTEGLARGNPIGQVGEVAVGAMVISVNHQTKEENLFLVVPSESPRHFCVQACDLEGSIDDHSNIMNVWSYELTRPKMIEWFFAVPAPNEPDASSGASSDDPAKDPAKDKPKAKKTKAKTK